MSECPEELAEENADLLSCDARIENNDLFTSHCLINESEFFVQHIILKLQGILPVCDDEDDDDVMLVI